MEDQEKQYDQKFPIRDYKKTLYNFSTIELETLQSINELIRIGQVIQVMADNFVNSSVNKANNFVTVAISKRLGLKDSPDIEILWSIEKKQLYIYEPRLWCSSCQIKKADFQYKGKDNINKVYCSECIDILKQQEAKKMESEIKKPTAEKKKIKS